MGTDGKRPVTCIIFAMSFSALIAEAVRGVEYEFRPGELAYLALTAKIEQPVRDRLAFLLHEKSQNGSVMVAREWENVDIAILIGGVPRVLLELKAAYTFDILKNGKPHSCFNEVANDVRKRFLRQYEAVEIYTLLLASHPHQLPNSTFQEGIAYYSNLQAQFNRLADAEQAYECSRERADEIMKNHPVQVSGRLRGGVAFGVEVSVSYWLSGPYHEMV